MPIPYKTTRYGCQYKCGTKRRQTAERALMHEKICYSNPANKACRLCKHESISYTEKETDEGYTLMDNMVRSCKIKEGADLITSQYSELELNYKSVKTGYIKPVTNCPFWELKK